MTKPKTYPVKPEKRKRVVLHIKLHEVEKKIRKPYAPPSKIHPSKKLYRRKPKHPKRSEIDNVNDS